jgi:hypothetical protein
MDKAETYSTEELMSLPQIAVAGSSVNFFRMRPIFYLFEAVSLKIFR